MFEKSIAISYALFLQILIGRKLGLDAYANFIVASSVLASISFVNFGVDISFVKMKNYSKLKNEVFDLLLCLKVALICVAAGSVSLLYLQTGGAHLWIIFLAAQLSCEALISTRIMHNFTNSKIKTNIIFSSLRVLLLLLIGLMPLSVREFCILALIANLIWMVCIIQTCQLGSFSINLRINTWQQKFGFGKVSKEIIPHHMIGYCALLLSRGDILIYVYLAKSSSNIAVVGAIGYLINTLSIGLASIMPLNLAAIKNSKNQTTLRKKRIHFIKFTLVYLLLIGAPTVILSNNIINLIIPNLKLETYEINMMLVLGFVNIWIIRSHVQFNVAMLLMYIDGWRLLKSLFVPLLTLGLVIYLAVILYEQNITIELYYKLMAAKILISLVWWKFSGKLVSQCGK